MTQGLISKEELKDYLEKNISFGGTEKKFRFYGMIDSLPSAFEGMTNGEVIQALFPNETLYEQTETCTYYGNMRFDTEWWNAPYKVESEDKE